MDRFDDDTLTRIIGPGVTAIFCQPMGRPGASSYDHKREHFAKHGGVRVAEVDGGPPCVPVWDFVIHRGDGEGVRLHPDQTNKKVSFSMMGAPISTAADGPQAGRGLTDGRGTFKRMLANTHTDDVPVTHSVATASSADTRGDGADWRGVQAWRGAWSSDDAWHASRGSWNSDANWWGAQRGSPPPPVAPPPKRAPPQPPRV